MINFEEELKKFNPSEEVKDIEEYVHNEDLTDVVDIFIRMIKNGKDN
ncbi:MAG: hypothetical protein J6U37_00630 [Lachnospiraceae bacterium]|jgi:hypothetical protein|nr:hypothetical protein [Lachnospiraceae bacterium]